MEQISVSFMNAGVPATGLSPIVNIREKNGTKRVTNGACKEIASGFYIYDFDAYNPDKQYLYLFDGTATLSNADRYIAGNNELDSYTNKYSRGRTAIPTTSYEPHFKKISEQLKKTKYPVYDDSELKGLVSNIGTLISSKTDDGILSQISTLQSQLSELNVKLESSSNSGGERLKEEMELLGANLDQLKESISEMVKSTETNVSTKMDDLHGKMATNLEEKLHPDYLSTHISKPVEALHKKIEELFIAQVQKNVPDNILNQFDIKLIKKDDTEALKELESMLD